MGFSYHAPVCSNHFYDNLFEYEILIQLNFVHVYYYTSDWPSASVAVILKLNHTFCVFESDVLVRRTI